MITQLQKIRRAHKKDRVMKTTIEETPIGDALKVMKERFKTDEAKRLKAIKENSGERSESA